MMVQEGDLLRGKHTYKVLKYLEEGGFSDIWVGKDLKTKRKVIIKAFRNKEFDSLEEAAEYFRREIAFIDIQAQYSQDTLKLKDWMVLRRNTEDPCYIMITNYIRGLDLYDWFEELLEEEREDFYPYLVRTIYLPLAKYLQYCHNHGILHRDLSPGNIIIKKKKSKRKYVPVVIDLGASINFDPAQLFKPPKLIYEMENTDEDTISTEGFAAPEVNEGKFLIVQSDIYSFGAIMYYTLTQGDEIDEPEEESEYVLNPYDYNDDCPEELADMVYRCTQYEPSDRYLSFDEIIEELQEYLKKHKPASRKSKRTSRKRDEDEEDQYED